MSKKFTVRHLRFDKKFIDKLILIDKKKVYN